MANIENRTESDNARSHIDSFTLWKPVEMLARSKNLLFVFSSIIVAFFLISLSGVLYEPLDTITAKIANRDYNGEGFIELIEAFCWALTFVVFLNLFIATRKMKGKTFRTTWFLVLAMFAFVAFGEEISWGQHIFGFSTPESFQEINKQKETNLHNLNISKIIGLSEENPLYFYLRNFTTLLNPIFYFSCFLLAFVFPLLKNRDYWPRWEIFQSLPVPSMGVALLCGVSFIALQICDRLLFDVGEIIELALAFVFVLFARDIAVDLKTES
jgi:hypothetical protein